MAVEPGIHFAAAMLDAPAQRARFPDVERQAESSRLHGPQKGFAESSTRPCLHHLPQDCTPRGSRGLPLLGSVLPFRKDPIRYLVDAWSTYGDVVRLNIRGMTVHLVTRPEHVEHVLVRRRHTYFKGYGYDDQKLLLGEGLITSEGELWERQHRMMQPLFTPRGTMRFMDVMVKAIRNMLARWEPLADDGRVIQVDDEMARLTGNIIVRILFGRDLDDEMSRIDEAFQFCVGFIDRRSADLIALPRWRSWYRASCSGNGCRDVSPKSSQASTPE